MMNIKEQIRERLSGLSTGKRFLNKDYPYNRYRQRSESVVYIYDPDFEKVDDDLYIYDCNIEIDSVKYRIEIKGINGNDNITKWDNGEFPFKYFDTNNLSNDLLYTLTSDNKSKYQNDAIDLSVIINQKSFIDYVIFIKTWNKNSNSFSAELLEIYTPQEIIDRSIISDGDMTGTIPLGVLTTI